MAGPTLSEKVKCIYFKLNENENSKKNRRIPLALQSALTLAEGLELSTPVLMTNGLQSECIQTGEPDALWWLFR